MKEQRERELEEAMQQELEFAAKRNEARYQELLMQAEESGQTQMPEMVELPPWPPIPPLPVSAFNQALTANKRKIPSEPTGTGVNKKVIFQQICRKERGRNMFNDVAL